jgi:parallel beta-helix repeat protein
MQNTLFKKGLVVGIIVLFVGLSVASSNANVLNVNNSKDKELCLIPLTSGNTIYVDDDNTEGPWDGKLEHPYQYIQDGVDNAGEGDTIYVFNGTYYENVEININFISLIGEDKTTTIIDGGGTDDVIFLNEYAYGVAIHGFTIQNGNIGIYSYSNLNKIYNNVIYHNNDNGIFLWGRFNTISRNHISYNGDADFFLQGGITVSSFNNKILYNNFSNNGCGINIYAGLNNLIEKNNFINNVENAYFLHMLLRLPNQWSRNYWDDWEGVGPKIIHGYLDRESKVIFNFDWHPARKPYEITFTNDIEGCGIE